MEARGSSCLTPGGVAQVATLESHQYWVWLGPHPPAVMLPGTHLEIFTGSLRGRHRAVHSSTICRGGTGAYLVSVPRGREVGRNRCT